jgi:hypothetical protein
MPLTFNQIVARIRSLSLSHDQVNDFYFGDPHEFLANGDITYPCVFLESFPGVIDRANKIQRFTFRLYAYDLVHVATDTEENETEVLSDMSSVADDLLSMFFSPTYQDDWIIGDTALKGFGTEKLDDMVAGAELEITIGVEYFADSCQVPAEDVEFPQNIDMPRTKILTFTATGGENTFAVATLANKHVLAAWRTLAYKRVTAAVPDDSEKIQVGTVDMGSGQGILGDGTATLKLGDTLLANEKVDFLYYGT